MATYLLSWNPEYMPWPDLAEKAALVAGGEHVERRWSCGNTKRIQVGDQVFLIRLGKEPRGIFATGNVTQPPCEATHWIAEKEESGNLALFVGVRFTWLIDPVAEPNFRLSLEELQHDSRFNGTRWNLPRAGTRIPDPISVEVTTELRRRIAAVEVPFASDIPATELVAEGVKLQVWTNRYERDRRARQLCIEKLGLICQACGFNFLEAYGSVAEDIIHVHHKVPLATIGAGYMLDPLSDLVPVCPNCHEVIHRRNPPYTVDEVRTMIAAQRASVNQ